MLEETLASARVLEALLVGDSVEVTLGGVLQFLDGDPVHLLVRLELLVHARVVAVHVLQVVPAGLEVLVQLHVHFRELTILCPCGFDVLIGLLQKGSDFVYLRVPCGGVLRQRFFSVLLDTQESDLGCMFSSDLLVFEVLRFAFELEFLLQLLELPDLGTSEISHIAEVADHFVDGVVLVAETNELLSPSLFFVLEFVDEGLSVENLVPHFLNCLRSVSLSIFHFGDFVLCLEDL